MNAVTADIRGEQNRKRVIGCRGLESERKRIGNGWVCTCVCVEEGGEGGEEEDQREGLQ